MTFEILEAILKDFDNTSKQETAYLLQMSSKRNPLAYLADWCHVNC